MLSTPETHLEIVCEGAEPNRSCRQLQGPISMSVPKRIPSKNVLSQSRRKSRHKIDTHIDTKIGIKVQLKFNQNKAPTFGPAGLCHAAFNRPDGAIRFTILSNLRHKF